MASSVLEEDGGTTIGSAVRYRKGEITTIQAQTRPPDSRSRGERRRWAMDRLFRSGLFPQLPRIYDVNYSLR